MTWGCTVTLNAGLFATEADRIRCGQPAIYRAWLIDCQGCQKRHARDECIGHPTCAEHGMKLREGVLPDGGQRASLLRICTLEHA